MSSTASDQHENIFISRAKRIAALIDEDVFPYLDKNIRIDQKSFSIYERIRIRAGSFADLENWGSSRPSQVETIAAFLSMISPLFHEGTLRLSGLSKIVPESVGHFFARSIIVDHGLRAVSDRGEPFSDIPRLFFLISLDDLLEFVDQTYAAYRTKQQLKSARESDASNASMIGAMTSLCNAQLAFELGVRAKLRQEGEKSIEDAEARAQEREFSYRQRRAAKHGRPKTQPTHRSVVVGAMQNARRSGRSLMDFIRSAEAGSTEDISIETICMKGLVRYEINCEALSGSKKIAKSTLDGWWNAAGEILK